MVMLASFGRYAPIGFPGTLLHATAERSTDGTTEVVAAPGAKSQIVIVDGELTMVGADGNVFLQETGPGAKLSVTIDTTNTTTNTITVRIMPQKVALNTAIEIVTAQMAASDAGTIDIVYYITTGT